MLLIAKGEALPIEANRRKELAAASAGLSLSWVACRFVLTLLLSEAHEKPSQVCRQVIEQLDVRRDIAWRYDSSGEQRVQSPGSRQNDNGFVVQKRGLVASPKFACQLCAGGSGLFQRCVVCPPYEGEALQAMACGNCLWLGKGNRYSLRLAFEKDGGG